MHSKAPSVEDVSGSSIMDWLKLLSFSRSTSGNNLVVCSFLRGDDLLADLLSVEVAFSLGACKLIFGLEFKSNLGVAFSGVTLVV